LTRYRACGKQGKIGATVFKDFLKQQQSGVEALVTTGTIGLHLVSGPLVGFAIGYGLDYWLDTGPWCKLLFFLLGIVAGFLNVYRDTRHLLKKMAAADAQNQQKRNEDDAEQP
jgi:ATP synthase protein I